MQCELYSAYHEKYNMKMKKNFVELYLAENSKDKVSVGNWTDWRWQMRNTIRKTDTVEAILGVTFSDDKEKNYRKPLTDSHCRLHLIIFRWLIRKITKMIRFSFRLSQAPKS